MASPGYQVAIERRGSNQVKVYKILDEENHELNWMFNLDGDDDPIYLREFHTPTRFLIMNWEGWLRAYDVATKEKVFERSSSPW